jgi:hypothetical protein
MKSSSLLVSPVDRVVTILSAGAVAAPLAQTQVSDRGRL